MLNDAQRRTITEVLTTHDRPHGLQGYAGMGKTTTLRGYRGGGGEWVLSGRLRATNLAANQLRDAGISAETLQRFLTCGGPSHATPDP